MVVHNVGKAYKCELCDMKFINTFNRDKHQLSHGEPTFECEQCGKKLVTKRSLEVHMHLHTGELLHCPYCPWKGNVNLERHKRIKHKQEYDNELAQESHLFSCPYCPWKGNMNLERHKRTKHKQEYENELAQESLNPQMCRKFNLHSTV